MEGALPSSCPACRSARVSSAGHAPVAQWTERLTSDQMVGGSNPSGRATDSRTKRASVRRSRLVSGRLTSLSAQPLGSGRAFPWAARPPLQQARSSSRSLPGPDACLETRAPPARSRSHSHWARQDAERQAAGPAWRESGYVFTSAAGGPLDPAGTSRAWTAALERAGIRHVRFHDARHSVASYAIAAGASPRLVADLLGHSQVSTTLNIYAHAFDAAQRETADGIARVLAVPGTRVTG
jgi:hypothetical protein